MNWIYPPNEYSFCLIQEFFQTRLRQLDSGTSLLRVITKRHEGLAFINRSGGTVGKESACQFKRRTFDSWVGKIPWGRAWRPTPVFLPSESYGQRSLVGHSPWGRKELDTTEQLTRPLRRQYSCSFVLPSRQTFYHIVAYITCDFSIIIISHLLFYNKHNKCLWLKS